MKKEKLPLQSRLQRQLFAVPDRMPGASGLCLEGFLGEELPEYHAHKGMDEKQPCIPCKGS
jgi:hypothetical protein